MTTFAGPALLTAGERAEYWLDLVARLYAEPLRVVPHERVAHALTYSFGATATAVHHRVDDVGEQVIYSPDGAVERWRESNRMAREVAATHHPLLAYYLATGDDRAHDTDAVPLLIPASRRDFWRESMIPLRAQRQVAIPLEYRSRRQSFYVIGRAEPYDPDDVAFARRPQG